MLPLSPDQLKWFVEHAGLIVAAPFLAGFLIIMGLRASKTLSMVVSISAVLYGLFHAIAIFQALATGGYGAPFFQQNIDWYVSDAFTLSVGVLVDNLCSLMLIVVTGISLLVQIYTHGYMREDPGYSRFYAYLSLFTGSMLGLVVSTNLFQMYGFWELVGVCSYFLIGFWWYKESAAKACMKAFVVNRIGDFGFLIGILMFFLATKDFWQGSVVLGFIGENGTNLSGVIHRAVDAGFLNEGSLFLISCLILMGPMAKSAQFPLHVWLPDAMEGPTPISALIHAATMVAAGVYLVARAYPLWLTPDGHMGQALHVVAIVGAITAFMAATIAMSQYDIKRVLAWSTCSQLGYMFVGLGCGAFTGGIFHLFNHAFFKAMLFLCSGAVIHGLHGEQDIRHMGGLNKSMPITHACFLIGTLAISGFPIFSGFFSKDEIISAAMHSHPVIGWLMMATAGMTAFYMFRLYFMTFTGSYRGNAHPHESPASMTWPLLVLAVPSMLTGYLGFNTANLQAAFAGASAEHGLPNHFAAFVYGPMGPHFEGCNLTLMGTSIAVAAVGIFLAFAMYQTKTLHFNKTFAESKEGFAHLLYNFSFNKWYMDNLYFGLVDRVFLPSFKGLWTRVDGKLVEGVVNGAGYGTMCMGEVLKYLQNGRGQYYALVIFASVAGIAWLAYNLPPR
ncbi:MAG: NADH-quinone oxidoreductase subunit L [Candidatus Obscuribacterales bacterium]|nr:NADH-quinone oxidoreductase subunit L [Candidatus Obscuribacterales bacterium]